MVGGHATAYSHPSQLDPRRLRPESLNGEPCETNAGEETAVVAPDGNWSDGGFTVE